MRHRAVLLFVASVGLVGLVAFFAGMDREVERGVVESHTGPRGVEPDPSERASLAVVDPAVVAAEEPAPEPVRVGRFVTITGRCVFGAPAAGLAGCEVRLAPGPELEDVTVHAGADGRFSAQVAVHPTARIQLDFRAAGHAVVTGRVVTLPKNVEDVDLGDVSLPRGGRLVAHVVDQAGDPAAGLDVRFEREAAGTKGRFGPQTTFRATSDINGRLESGVDVPCGVWRIVLPPHATCVSSPASLEIVSTGSLSHRIVVELPNRADVIAGVVVDSAGEPVPEASVWILDADARRTARTIADAAGAFVLVRGDAAGGAARLRAGLRRGGHARYESEQEFEWGTTGIQLALTDPGTLLVTVVEADSGRPVEHCALYWAKVQGELMSPTHGRWMDSNALGRMHVVGVPSGTIRLVVEPEDPSLATSERIEIAHGAGETAVVVELHRRVTLDVRLRLQDGSPVAGTRVELLRPASAAPIDMDTTALSPDGYARFLGADDCALRCDVADSDASGSLTLGCVAQSVPLTLRLTGPLHLPKIVRDIVIREGMGPLEVVVDRGAVVNGAVRPLPVLDQLVALKSAQVVLTYAGAQTLPRALARRTADLDRMGEFTASGLWPGRWTVQLQGGYGSRPSSESVAKSFEPIFVEADGTYTVELDISDLEPAVLSGQLFVDGVPHADRVLQLVRVTPWEKGGVAHASYTTVETDAEGRFEASGLRSGRYHAVLRGRDGQLISPEAVEVTTGEQQEYTFHIDTGHLHVRVVDAQGEPLADERFVVEQPDIGFRMILMSSEDGVIETKSIAGNTYSIRVTSPGPGGEALTLGDVAVPSGRSSGLIEVTARAE